MARPLHQAALPTSSLRNVHEDVLPPVPLPPTRSPSLPAQPPLVPLIKGVVQQRHWLATIARMRAQPGADLRELAEIEAHITTGVSLSLLTVPTTNSYANTPSVTQNAAAVRTRLHEYMQFGAVTRLPADTPLQAEGLRIQPLHVIIKAGKKPRLVIDLSRNLTTTYSTTTSATAVWTMQWKPPGRDAGTASWICPTVSCRSPCTRQCASTSAFVSKASYTNSRICLLG